MNPNLIYLIVDDADSVRSLVKNLCLELGVNNVHEAKDGKEAIAVLQQNNIDVVICDLNMPELTGMDVLKFVRGHDSFRHIYFMFITAGAEHESVTHAINEGVDEFLVKPFTPSKFREKVASMLQRLPRKRKSLSVQDNMLMPVGEIGSNKGKAKSDKQPVVVIVDDIPANIDIIVEILKPSYQIKVATNGQKALNLINTSLPDLVLLDIMMPGMDGYEVCQSLKASPDTVHIPIIFLSTRNEVVDITHGLELGAVDYITKPVNPDILKARVKTQIQLKLASDEMAFQIENLMAMTKLREDVERITQHDLKNPLTVIIGKSESLVEEKYLHVEQRKDIETIRDTALNMLGMINRSLDLFKMETGNYVLEPKTLDLAVITLKVVNDYRSNAQKEGITITFNAPNSCFILAEELLCFSILNNLIKNAIEASPPDSNVLVSLQEDDESSMVTIHNQGVIPEEIRGNFFEKYITSGKEQGTGIGTYSAKLMANAQNGDITFKTNHATGTTVTLTLPSAKNKR